uniref:Ig-like domain-containing protein n=1 Tax=Junco hyemalis TaxID=40217 RepID=A0A8C5IFS9_JUNHY
MLPPSPGLCTPSPSLEFPCPSLTTPRVPHCPLVSHSPAGVPPSGVSLSAQPPGGQVALGDSLVLSCKVAIGTGPLSFSWHREGSGALPGTGPHLELHHVGDNDSGQYRCRVSDGNSVAESDPLNVTVLGERDPRAGDDPTHSTPIPPRQVPALSVSLQCPWPMPPSPLVPCHTSCVQVTT